MTEKEKLFIDALCDEYGIDYPEESTDECYDETLESYNFKSWCYINWQWLSLRDVVRVARRAWILDDDE